MIAATNTAHLDPLYRTPASVTTGWGATTVYAGEDYITDGASLIEASLLKPADRQKLARRLGVCWPASRPLPTQKAVSDTVDRALVAERTPVEFLGVAAGAAFLQIGGAITGTVVTRTCAYFLPARLPNDMLITPAGQHTRRLLAGTAVQIVLRDATGRCLVTAEADGQPWWYWMEPCELMLADTDEQVSALSISATMPAARLAYLVKLTGANRITATPYRKSGPNTYVLWVGEIFAGLLAVA